ncbi:hypothetical protein [Streptomyces sp. NRRL S-340]|uniref:hypothetical protein n=1 Tax=Streptomyces sp. NRRL S-340 TaxID=1463901 RepID=UPI000689FD48|nr:hypothetical protein [Streptomyces sp. NRRL S-340]
MPGCRPAGVLERHFDDPVTACQLDALIEGLSVHRALDTAPHDRAPAADTVARTAASASTPRAASRPAEAAAPGRAGPPAEAPSRPLPTGGE